MRRSLVFLLTGTVASVVFLAPTDSLVAQQDTNAYISVSARGDVSVTPDRAKIELAVETRASTAAAAVQQNATRQTTVIQALRALKIPDSQISTANFSVEPESRNDKELDAPRIVSYLVSNTILVTLKDISTVGKTLDAAIGSGANSVSSVSFYLSNADSAYRNALAAAVRSARDQAAVMATAAGGRLGPMVEMSSAGLIRPVPVMRMAAGVDMSAASTPIMSGEQTVSASINTRWIFVQNH